MSLEIRAAVEIGFPDGQTISRVFISETVLPPEGDSDSERADLALAHAQLTRAAVDRLTAEVARRSLEQADTIVHDFQEAQRRAE